jgi:phenylalanyl-tRNA synthetase alpha chain
VTEAAELERQLVAAQAEALAAIEAAGDLAALEEARVRALGRKAPLARARAALGTLDEQARRAVGRLANDVQGAIEAALTAKRERLAESELKQRFERERADVTLPGDAVAVGGVHPLTRTVWEIVDIFIGLGYSVAEGPEAELSVLNFDALNTPPEHPSKSPADTFYVAGTNEEVCLRTQTSPVQIRVMESRPPPVYVVSPGRTYRRDAEDATHLMQFFQIEGLAVDEGVTMADLKGTLELFARQVFGKDLDIRLRPHHFPFTEPSAEMDVQCFNCRGAGCRVCKQEGWIEILGCGMVHPALFEWVGYDPERYSGFAFGMGAERIAALAHGVTDIRHFYENDLRLLTQFGGPP